MATIFRLSPARIVVGILLLATLAGCSSMLFYPMKPWLQNPANQGLAYEDIVLIHPDGLRLHGWWLPAAGNARGTVYFLHGNAQNISTHLMNVRWLPAQGFNVFMLDYRGYGLSDGEPALPAVLDDIQLGLDWLQASGRLDNGPLIVFAQSLGASMSTVVLARESNAGRFNCAAFEAGFSSYRTITADVMKKSWLLWGLQPAVVPWMPDDIDPIDAIANIQAPLLILHSQEDEVIPYAHGEALYHAATPPKQFQPLHGQHIESTRDPAVQNRLLAFFETQCSAPMP